VRKRSDITHQPTCEPNASPYIYATTALIIVQAVDPIPGRMKINVSTAPSDSHESCKALMKS